jgi:hypothetical protein
MSALGEEIPVLNLAKDTIASRFEGCQYSRVTALRSSGSLCARNPVPEYLPAKPTMAAVMAMPVTINHDFSNSGSFALGFYNVRGRCV